MMENQVLAARFAPFSRVGFAVAARVACPGEGESKRFVLRSSAAQTAIDDICDHREEFHTAIKSALVDSGWSISEGIPTMPLRRFAVNRFAGVVIDFDELMIECDGTKLIVRTCVTVCVDDLGSLEDKGISLGERALLIDSDNEHNLHSKMWVRFGCIESNGTASNQLKMSSYPKLFSICDDLSREIVTRISKPYLSAIIRISELDYRSSDIALSEDYKIESFTISTSDNEFNNAFEKIMDRNIIDDNENTTFTILEDLKETFLCASDTVVPFEDISFNKGIYWISVDQKLTRLVGLAYNPTYNQHMIADLSIPALRRMPSSVMSIVSTSSLGAML